MKRFTLLVALCALAAPAFAQAPDCKAVADPAARLACYDKASAPAATQAAKPVPRGRPVDSTYVDSISSEDALMNARLKNICRGC